MSAKILPGYWVLGRSTACSVAFVSYPPWTAEDYPSGSCLLEPAVQPSWHWDSSVTVAAWHAAAVVDSLELDGSPGVLVACH